MMSTDHLLLGPGRPNPNFGKGGKISGNAPCPCASGKKFKKCCMYKGVTNTRPQLTEEEKQQRAAERAQLRSKAPLLMSLAVLGSVHPGN